MIIVLNNLMIKTSQRDVYGSINNKSNIPIKVGIFLYDFNDPYFNMIKQSLQDIQNGQGNEVEFTFFDAKGNQSIQVIRLPYYEYTRVLGDTINIQK